MKHSNQPLISIVTVCYNVASELSKTMDSVINQSYENIEYIIVDGNSSDNSVEIIKKYEKIALDKRIVFKWVSEKDKGIYDAMNKGIDMATGEWINFMNAGDSIHNKNTIQRVVDKLDNNYSVASGAINYQFSRNNNKVKYLKNHLGPLFIQFSHHQASFIRSDLMKKYRYDIEFKIRGEIDFFAKLFTTGERWLKLDFTIADFDVSGISSSVSWKNYSEEVKVGSKYLKLFRIKHSFYYLIYVIPRSILRNVLPTKLVLKIRSGKWIGNEK